MKFLSIQGIIVNQWLKKKKITIIKKDKTEITTPLDKNKNNYYCCKNKKNKLSKKKKKGMEGQLWQKVDFKNRKKKKKNRLIFQKILWIILDIFLDFKFYFKIVKIINIKNEIK